MFFENNKIQLSPHPNGCRFAITFVDDTDFSTIENTKPVYDYLYKKGIKGTKTVWVNRAKRTSSYRMDLEKPIKDDTGEGLTVQNKDYLNFIYDLKNKGFEIALHGISSGNSYREEIISGLNMYRELFGDYPDINVFHKTNIDNMYSGNDKLNSPLLRIMESMVHKSDYQGHIQGSPYFWGDLAKKYIKYTRLPFHTIREINTYKLNPSMPFHDTDRPFVNYWFINSDGSDCSRFNSLFFEKNLNKLIREEGISIVYTHFAKGFVSKKVGEYILNHKFKETIDRICARQGLWSPTVSELLSRLQLLKKVNINADNHKIIIENRSDEEIENLTLRLSDGVSIEEEKDICHLVDDGSRAVVKLILPNSSVQLKTNIGDRIKINSVKSDKAKVTERMKIEWYNYIGMIYMYLKR